MNLESISAQESMMIEVLERATNASKPRDPMAEQQFCVLVKSNEELINQAHELLVTKMNSPNIQVALRAVDILQEAMMTCGTTFQKKTAKFKFLNKLIEIVNDDIGDKSASIKVKKRIMDCFLLWTVEFPDKTKIRECYENLKKKVSFEQETFVKMPESSHGESILGKDEALVAKLIREGGTENCKAANLLIRSRFELKAKHDEMLKRHRSILQKVNNTLEVFSEMIENYTGDDTDTLNQLYTLCLEYENQLQPICTLNCLQDKQIQEDTQTSYDMLLKCLHRYREVIQKPSCCTCLENSSNECDCECDITNISNVQLLSNIIPINSDDSELHGSALVLVKSKSSLDELSDLFGIQNINSRRVSIENSPVIGDLLGQFDDAPNTSEKRNEQNTIQMDAEDKSNKGTVKELEYIDELSEQFFKQTLQSETRQRTFKSEQSKVTLNDLAKRNDKSNGIDKSPKGNGCETDSIGADAENSTRNTLNSVKYAANGHQTLCISLSKISLDLEKMPSLMKEERVLIDDEHVTILVRWASAQLYPNTLALILSATNNSPSIMNNLQFWTGVKKPGKVRQLLPTRTNVNRFISLSPKLHLDQAVLIFNPTQEVNNVDLSGILQYSLADDPDPFTAPFSCTIPFPSG